MPIKRERQGEHWQGGGCTLEDSKFLVFMEGALLGGPFWTSLPASLQKAEQHSGDSLPHCNNWIDPNGRDLIYLAQ